MSREPMHPDVRLTRDGARAVDRAALVECGIQGYVLMEHAGRSVAELVLARLADRAREEREHGPASAHARADARGDARDRVVIVCGGGNNGGDGFVIARFLRDAGLDVVVFAVAPTSRTRGDALLARAIASRCGVEILPLVTASDVAAARARVSSSPPHVVIDALLGTGFRGAMRSEYAAAIDLVNEVGARAGVEVVAVDLPSGLDADTGARAAPTVHATVTATFVARKAGFDAESARAVLGEVRVLPIGAPAEIVARFTLPSSSPHTA